MPLIIEHIPVPTDEARALIEELEAELSRDYPADQCHGLAVERVFQPNIQFFIAREAGIAVGCGGIAFEPEFAELKRIYTRPPFRHRGIAQSLIAHLEQSARTRGIRRLVLETGDILHAATRLYERAGFTRCNAFGDYAKMPPRTIERSVFFEKWIA